MPDERPLEDLLSEMSSRPQEHPFRPCAVYNRDGDTLEVYLSPEPYVAERVSTLWTVYVANDNRERVVGFAIKKIRKHFGYVPQLAFLAQTGQARVRVLICGAQFAHLYSLEREPAGPDSREVAPTLPERIDRIARDFGDTEVTVQSLEFTPALA